MVHVYIKVMFRIREWRMGMGISFFFLSIRIKKIKSDFNHQLQMIRLERCFKVKPYKKRNPSLHILF